MEYPNTKVPTNIVNIIKIASISFYGVMSPKPCWILSYF